LPSAYPFDGHFFFAGIARVPVSARPSEIVYARLPVDLNLPEEEWDLPAYWAVLFVRAPVKHPAGCALPSPTYGECPLRLSGIATP